MSRAKVRIYRDGYGEWRWRVKARNGRIIGSSSEAYRTRRAARNNLWNLAVVLDTGEQWELI